MRVLCTLLVALLPATAHGAGPRLCGGLAFVCSEAPRPVPTEPVPRLLGLPGAPRPGASEAVARWSRPQIEQLRDAPRPVIEAAAEALLDAGRPADARPLLERLDAGASPGQACVVEALRLEADRREGKIPRSEAPRLVREQLRRLDSVPESERCATLTLETCATLAAGLLPAAPREPEAARVAGEILDALALAARPALPFPRLPGPLWPTPGALRFARGALAWSTGAWEDCARAFAAVPADAPERGDASVHAGRCQARRVDAIASPLIPRGEFRQAPGEAPPRALLPWEQEALDHLDRAACLAADGPELRIAAARLLLDAGRPGEAAAELRASLERASPPERPAAALLFLEAAGRAAARGDEDCTDEAEALRARVSEEDCSGRNGPSCASLERLDSSIAQAKAAVLRRRAEEDALRANELHEQAGKALHDAARRCALDPMDRREPPTCERPEELLWAAAEAFAAAHLPLKSIRARLPLLAPRYRMLRTEQARRSVLAIARSYESLADFEAAASWYENLATEYPAAPEVAPALERAVQLRLALSQEPEAARGSELLRSRAHRAHASRAVAASLAVARYHAERGSWEAASRRLDEAWRFLQEQGTPGDRIQALALRGKVRGALGLSPASDFRAALDLWGRSGRPADAPSLDAVAEARLHELGETARRLQALRAPVLPGRPEIGALRRHLAGPFAAWLAQRRQGAEALERAHEDMVKSDPPFRDPWQAVALEQAFGAWLALEREASSPRWTGLPGFLPGLREELDERLVPLRERTTSAAWACLRSAVQAASFGEGTRTCERWLATSASYRPLDDALTPRPAWQGSPPSERPPLWLAPRPAR